VLSHCLVVVNLSSGARYGAYTGIFLSETGWATLLFRMLTVGSILSFSGGILGIKATLRFFQI
jgi:hypothetical protein